MLGFVGPFCDANYGDYAMLVNDLLDFDVGQATLFSYDGGVLEGVIRGFLGELDLKVVNVSVTYSYEPSFTDTYHVEYDNDTYVPLEILSLVSNVDEVRQAVESLDALVVCGGGYFNDVWSARHRKAKLLAIMATILLARECRVETYFLGNTYGPFDKAPQAFSSFFSMLQGAHIAARDSIYSPSEIRGVGYLGPVDMLPDDLYFVNEKLSCNNDPIVHGEYVIWESYCSIGELRENVDKIEQFVSVMKGVYGCEVCFMSMGDGFGGRRQEEFLREHVKGLSFLDLETRPIGIGEVNNIIGNARFIVCNRYHAFLTAVSRNVPCVHVLKRVMGDFRYYYCKSKGLLDQVFQNQTYRDSLFLSAGLWTTLGSLEGALVEVAAEQRGLFNGNKALAECEMKARRDAYIEQIRNRIQQ